MKQRPNRLALTAELCDAATGPQIDFLHPETAAGAGAFRGLRPCWHDHTQDQDNDIENT